MDATNNENQVRLRNGVCIPIFGLGTSHNGGYSHPAVVYALRDCGYRLVDTAKRYGCEERLREAIKESGVPREDLFLTTKLWPLDYGGLITRQAFFGSMRRLGSEYIDLFMLHMPNCPSTCTDKRQLREDTWRQLERLYDEGYIRALGVSNFLVEHLEEMEDYCSVMAHVNQVEFHPYQNPKRLHNYCKDKGISLEGYCPLAKGTILNENRIADIATRVGRTPAQVLIRWSVQNGVITIPMSTKEARILENSRIFDFKLSARDMETLDNLHDGRRMVNLDVLQSRVDNPLPDGYKLAKSKNGIKDAPCFLRDN